MSTFCFKQFTVKQEKSAAKIGTDGVLLGAWTPLGNLPQAILEIGAGTGVISLMLAQRSENVHITAIEIEDNAFEECLYNFQQSLWKERLKIIHTDFKDFDSEQKFDVIVSNPPFYTETYFAQNQARNHARNVSSLPFELLVEKANQLLNNNGIFSVILPFKEEQNFIRLAEKFQLYPFKVLRVKGNENTEIKRSLIAFSKVNKTININNLIIEKERHHYTDAYISLTKDFYLKM